MIYKHQEKEILNNIYGMGVQSLDPESFEQFCRVLDILAKNRNIEWRSNYDN